MRQYLNGHPAVDFSAVREPNFFNTDFSSRLRKFRRRETYERECFGSADPEAKYVAEKTVWYLYSKAAVENIYQYNPAAKFLVFVRNPLELVRSLHNKLFEIQQEDVGDFRSAWNLQEKRAAGEKLPAGCPDRRLLLYGEVGKLGQQLQRLYRTVPREQVKLVVFDDIEADTPAVYRDILEFLELPDHGRPEFEEVNGNKEVRMPALQYALRQSSKRWYRPVARVSEFIKSQLGIKRWNLMYRLSQLNVRRTERKELPAELRAELAEYFRADVERLSELAGRDLSGWLLE